MQISQFTPCSSSAIKGFFYDPSAQTLYLQFTTGNSYAYPEFSNDNFAAFQAAESKGQHYGKHIRGKYEARPVHVETEEQAPAEG